MMEVYASGLDHQLEDTYNDFVDRFGIGPCGAYAAIRREHGWGEIAAALIPEANGDLFTHYLIVDNGIIDWCNPSGQPYEYTEIEILPHHEIPELVGDAELEWMREHITLADTY